MSNSNKGEFDAKEARLKDPSGWIKLTRYETVRLIIDALLEAPPEHAFNKSQLERRTGLSREAVREHIPLLVELGVVDEINEGGWAEYRLNDDGKVTHELFELNSAVNSVLAGEPKNRERTPDITMPESSDVHGETPRPTPTVPEGIDNSRPVSDDDELVDRPPEGALSVDAD